MKAREMLALGAGVVALVAVCGGVAKSQGAKTSGAAIVMPSGENLRNRPDLPSDLVLGVDREGRYVLNAKLVGDGQLEGQLKSLYGARAVDKVMYVQADRDAAFARLQTAGDIAARSGVCVMSLLVQQIPGTASWVRDDSRPEERAFTRRAIDVQLPDPTAPPSARGERERIVVEVAAGSKYSINTLPVTKENLGRRLREIYDPRPRKTLFMRSDADAKVQDVAFALDAARGAGVIVLGMLSGGAAFRDILPDIDLSVPVTLRDGDAEQRAASGMVRCRRRDLDPAFAPPGTPMQMGADQPYMQFQVERPATEIPGTGVPKYPDVLKSAGVTGEVLAQFVVDTTGVAEMSTFRVLKASHELFAVAVRNALSQMRFRPAEVGGKKVKQLVQQMFWFRQTP